MRIFLNGLAASAGAGLTYLRNVVPHLSASANVHTTLAVQPELRAEYHGLSNVEVISPARTLGSAQRFWYEQRKLPAMIRRAQANVLISAGNFALRNSPVPQILLSGNSLYTSAHFSRDLLSRHEYCLLMDNCVKRVLAKRSVIWADQTVAPSRSFAADLRRWTGKEIGVINHGFDPEKFFDEAEAVPEAVAAGLRRTDGCLRLLFVSHYNHYRNFETLLRALPLAQVKLWGRKVALFFTCKLTAHGNPGAYDATSTQQLVEKLGIGENVIELGTVEYRALHHLYRACDIYVSAAYAETFAHPLVEAMASGLPVVASDLPVHREICRDAALYFPCFSPEQLAERIVEVSASGLVRKRLSSNGSKRSADFSWARHVAELLKMAEHLREKQAVKVKARPEPYIQSDQSCDDARLARTTNSAGELA